MMFYHDHGPDFDCYFQGCRDRAICRININMDKDGNVISVNAANGTPIWRHYCLAHYEDFWTQHAKQWCEMRGLKTRELQFKFIKDKLKNSRLLSGIHRQRIPIEETGCNTDWGIDPRDPGTQI